MDKDWYFAASKTVAIWVLSPISAMKNRKTVAPNAPYLSQRLSGFSSLSGRSSHKPTAMKLMPTAHLTVSGETVSASHTPTNAETK